jgi:hypothetical protein
MFFFNNSAIFVNPFCINKGFSHLENGIFPDWQISSFSLKKNLYFCTCIKNNYKIYGTLP